MSVTIKSAREIELMRAAGKILAKVHQNLGEVIKPGMTTYELDQLGEDMIRSYGCIPSFKDYHGYPAAVCISINDEVVHGIPDPKKVIQDGDIVSLDIGVIYKGYHSDAARTHGVGTISTEANDLIVRTRESFFAGIQYAMAGNHLHDISNAIGKYAEKFGYGVVRDLVGHGIGANLHEDPEIPNFIKSSRGIKLKPGMTLAIEPMINQGSYEVEWLDDDWTVVTGDGSLSAHYENTILITDGIPEILSITEKEIELKIWTPRGEM
ncbi:MAG: type I methionyl aminopeptidase [Lachnospiraceae bacterium]